MRTEGAAATLGAEPEPRSGAAPRPFAVTFPMVLAIAAPMTLAYLTTPLIGVTDMAVIGQLGDAALIGAVALGALLFDVLGSLFNFLRMGTTGLVAQAMGAEDREAETLVLWRALALAGAGGVLILLLGEPLLALFLWSMGASAAVSDAAAEYVRIRLWGIPLTLANYAILGWLLGLGRAGSGLALQLVLGVTNIALSILFVLGLEWGIAGVALGSVLAEGAALAVGVVLIRRSVAGRRRPGLREVFRGSFGRMLAVNGDIVVRSTLLMVIYMLFTASSARFGDVTLAANAVLMNLFLVASYFLDGLATAAEQLGGRAVGARHRPAFDRTVRLTLTAGLALSAGLSTVFLLGGAAAVDGMTTAADVREVARVYLLWAALTPLAGAAAFVMDGLYIGATWTAAMRNTMVAAVLLFAATLFLAPLALGNHGLWLAVLVQLAARGAIMSALVPRLSRGTFGSSASGP